jgi:NAD+ synthase (glutamine-hydrolysing)
VARLRIGLAQVNATVGDLAGNSDKVIEWTMRAAEQGARVVVFPEMVLTGYPVEDLALRRSFVDASIARLHSLAAELAGEGLDGIAVVLGYLDRRTDQQPRVGIPAGAPLDAAAVLHGGRVAITSAKHHLPNYGVFDEYRYFLPGETLPVFRLTTASGDAVDVAVAICEDLWQDGGPVAVTRQAGASLLVVPNASPYERNKDDLRLALCQRRAREAGAVLAYANMVGGQDELVFDGDSLVVAPDGTLLARGPQFDEALVLADLELAPADPLVPAGRQRAAAADAVMTIERIELAPLPAPDADATLTAPMIWPRLDDLAEIYGALVLGTRDYVRKNSYGRGSVLIGLSGGIDSALTTTIATDALGADRVNVVLNPGPYSSEHSVADAEDLARRQGISARVIPIKPMVDGFASSLELHGIAAENLQARIRGMIWMSLANEEGRLVLACGNKSELAVGYSTLYGDAVGAYAPIKDVFKTLVWELARWRNQRAALQGRTPPIPENSITKPPSAELAPGQLDTDSLPDYYTLDPLLDDYVQQDMGAAELVAAGYDPELVERVIRLVDRAEYKRRQYPPGPKITAKNFGRDRRLPITSRWREPRIET